MRSRRLPGQRQQNDLPGRAQRPPPPEPRPLPAEVYFDEQARKRVEPRTAEVEEPPEAPFEEHEQSSFTEVARSYGAPAVAIGGLLFQISLGILMLPRIVNAAETLLVRPTQLIILAAIGIVEVTLAGFSCWTRSWFAALTSIGLGMAWWIYLLVQLA